ncbi:MAG: hypothetical protein L0206_00645 [Actinobacteria bacterium]|nr:hypothetical protein [Actinomycetota bacterium]
MEQARPEPEGRVVPLRTAPQPPPPPEQVFEQALRIAFGLAALAFDTLVETVGRTLGREPATEGEVPADEQTTRVGGIPLFAGAVLGIGIEAGRWGARALTTLTRSTELLFDLAPGSSIVRAPVDRAGDGLRSLDARWREHRPRDEEAASEFLRLLVPQVLDAVLDQVDLNELVHERVDVDRIVAGVDLAGVVERIDVDAIVAGLDLDEIVRRIDMRSVVDRLPLDDIVGRIDIDGIVTRVDLDKVVQRVDLDAVAARLDIEAILGRIDLTAIAREVIDEIDLPEIIRESMGSMTSETVGGIRVQSMNADRAISTLVDRVLQRRGRDEAPAGDRPEEPS